MADIDQSAEYQQRLYDLASPRQREFLDAIAKHGNATAANAALGLSNDVVARSLRALKTKASLSGFAPGHFNHGVAPGYAMGKVTVARDRDGVVERTWERQNPDAAHVLRALEHAVAAMSEQIKHAAPVPFSAKVKKDLLALYTFTDYHLGMMAWHREGGADWDTGIAEDTARKAMAAMVAGSPAADTGLVNIQGDFMHYDGLAAITPTHGHVLDADSRFGKVVEIAIRLIRGLVAQALTKHRHVILLIAEGNHDIVSSLWLRKLFACLYENEPRVTVHDSDLPFYAIEWGNTLLGFHHGHLRKNESLPALFAAQFREAWGRCAKVYIHTGHRHHREIKDYPGCELRQHPTMAARDAHAARGGWWSERRIDTVIYHRAYGEFGSHTITPEMLD